MVPLCKTTEESSICSGKSGSCLNPKFLVKTPTVERPISDITPPAIIMQEICSKIKERLSFTIIFENKTLYELTCSFFHQFEPINNFIPVLAGLSGRAKTFVI